MPAGSGSTAARCPSLPLSKCEVRGRHARTHGWRGDRAAGRPIIILGQPAITTEGLPMKTMRAVQVPRPGGPLELVERPIPEPGTGQVRMKVHACGVCHSDSLVKEGLMPGIEYPRVPGHEVVGVIDAVGEGVVGWNGGEQVGVGWHGGYCGRCEQCRRGDFFACVTQQVTGLTFDGGYGQYMVAPVSAVARFPQGLSPVEAAPLLCAGITTYNALRNSGATGGEVVAVL